MMSKQDFIGLANIMIALKPVNPGIQSHYTNGRIFQWEKTRDTLAEFCAMQNGNFKRDRWLGYIAGDNGPNGGSR